MTEQPPLPQLPKPDVCFVDGQLVSSEFDDIFFSAQDGLAETQHVFIAGTSLEKMLAENTHLVIGETGFGTGLNLCAVMALLDTSDSQCRIDYISFEASPLEAGTADRALSAFSGLDAYRHQLIASWPRRWPGVHHVELCNGQLHLQLHYGQAEDILPTLDFTADTWFLDGFAPARNDSLWSETVLRNIGRLSRAGTKLASFTVAGAVRQRLAETGFEVTKQPGFGHKRHMLVAEMKAGRQALPATEQADQHVLIVGAGIAGCALSYHLDRLNISHQLIDAETGVAGQASGNPAGLVLPHLSVGDSLAARLSLSAFADMLAPLDASGAILSEQVVSLDMPDIKARRQQKLATQGYPEDLACYRTADELSEMLNISVDVGGMVIPQAKLISPRPFCAYLAASEPIKAQITDMARHAAGWLLTSSEGVQFDGTHLVLSSGHALPDMLEQLGYSSGRFQLTTGQISLMPARDMPEDLPALNFGGYLARLPEQVMLGASYDFTLSDRVLERAHRHNLALLPEQLHHLIDTDISGWQGRVANRLATEFRMPLCDYDCGGQIEGLSVLGALGSRGLTLGFFLARHLAGQIAGRPDFLQRRLKDAMSLSRVFGVSF